MTLEEAIEILIAYKAGRWEDTGPELDDALALGIEALRELMWHRKQGCALMSPRLPGETEGG